MAPAARLNADPPTRPQQPGRVSDLPNRTWQTRSQVAVAERGREFAWVVGGIPKTLAEIKRIAESSGEEHHGRRHEAAEESRS